MGYAPARVALHKRRSPAAMITMDLEAQKRAAAARALEFVRPGMRLGLGSGSTAKHFVELLAQRVLAGLEVIAPPHPCA